MTKQTIIISLLLAASLCSCGQHNSSDPESGKAATAAAAAVQDEISISDLKLGPAGNRFPEVHFSENKIAEEKVNTFLQLEELGHLPGIFKKSPFEHVIPTDGGMSGSIDFQQWRRNETIPGILSITLEGEATGAYSENFSTHYNFEIATGNKIILKDLFSERGMKAVAQLLSVRVNKIINDHLDGLKAQPAPVKEEDLAMLNDEIALFEGCLENVMDYKLRDYAFYFSQDSIIFERDRCSNHAMRALDELDKFSIPMAFSEMEAYYTPYGRNLVHAGKDIIPAPTPEGKLYKGFLDKKYAIGALISDINDDGSLSMTYWYEKTKAPITWSGSFSNTHFSMTETLEQKGTSEDIAKIEADWKGSVIEGAWINLRTKQPLKLELESY